MALRLANSVIEGRIDNRRAGRITGKLVLAGQDQPVRLKLQGDCLRDLAGCLITFRNPAPEPAATTLRLHALQAGHVGDMTASRRVYVPAVPLNEALALSRNGKAFPKRLTNCLYLEWFSETNGRVVIEACDFVLHVSEHEWSMSVEEEKRQVAANLTAMRRWIGRIEQLPDWVASLEEREDPSPMDEFDWERFMQESDATAEQYGQLLDKYLGHPDCEKIVAREMGWTWLDDLLDADDRGLIEHPGDDDVDDAAIPEPNPLTKGRDWVRDRQGHVRHPLALRCSDLGMATWQLAEKHGLEKDTDIAELVSDMQLVGARLGGALNDLAYATEMDAGFVIACLKRGLEPLHHAIGVAGRIEQRSDLAPAFVRFRKDLFDIREQILALMDSFRRQDGY